MAVNAPRQSSSSSAGILGDATLAGPSTRPLVMEQSSINLPLASVHRPALAVMQQTSGSGSSIASSYSVTKATPSSSDGSIFKPSTEVSMAQTSSGRIRTISQRSSASPVDRESNPAKPAVKRSRSTQSRNLFGSLHVSSMRLPAPEGDLGVWYFFPVRIKLERPLLGFAADRLQDLTVQYEGE